MVSGSRRIKIGIFLLAALCAAWKPILDWAQGFQGTAVPWYVQGILSFHNIIPITAVGLLLILQVYQEYRDNSPKKLLKRFVDHLHRQHFPEPTGGSNPNYRVTFFSRGRLRRNSLGVYVRLGSLHPKSRARWDIRRSEAEDYHGVAGFAWAREVFVTIDGLPDYDGGNDNDRANYLSRTFIKQNDVVRLHWKARSYRGLAIKDSKSEKVGVLMMESREPQGLTKITPETLWSEAEYLQFLLG